MGLSSRQPRRLNRSQIQEILERNMQLYRNEENAATYLVELALYLLEYEYDWADTPERAPASVKEQMAAAGTPLIIPEKPERKSGAATLSFEEAWAEVTGTDAPAPQAGTRKAAVPNGNSGGVATRTTAPVATRSVATMSAPESKPVAGDSKYISPDLRKLNDKYGTMTNRCPHCGTAIDRETLCPSCKNLVR